jgi:outer membrane biosynthesis protein TonB
MADRRKDKRTSRLSVVISLVFHGVLIGALVFIAAREGILGKELKKIAVTMVPKEKPPEEKPKEKPPEEKPLIEEPKPDLPQPVLAPRVETPRATAPATAPTAAPSAAPAAAALPAFDFEGGKAVETASDPNAIYKGFVEYTLRSRWNRPEGIDDEKFVAEVELAIDPTGRVQGSTWQKGSGNAKWDNSVRQVLGSLSSIGRVPPKGFPDKVIVRFDVQVATEIGVE